MSDHASTQPAAGGHGDGHGDGHGQDDHAHGDEALGPVDVAAWGAGAVGVVLGLIVAGCLAISTGLLG